MKILKAVILLSIHPRAPNQQPENYQAHAAVSNPSIKRLLRRVEICKIQVTRNGWNSYYKSMEILVTNGEKIGKLSYIKKALARKLIEKMMLNQAFRGHNISLKH